MSLTDMLVSLDPSNNASQQIQSVASVRRAQHVNHLVQQEQKIAAQAMQPTIPPNGILPSMVLNLGSPSVTGIKRSNPTTTTTSTGFHFDLTIDTKLTKGTKRGRGRDGHDYVPSTPNTMFKSKPKNTRRRNRRHSRRRGPSPPNFNHGVTTRLVASDPLPIRSATTTSSSFTATRSRPMSAPARGSARNGVSTTHARRDNAHVGYKRVAFFPQPYNGSCKRVVVDGNEP